MNGNVSDSDDSFFDDASFDTMSETSTRVRVKSPAAQTSKALAAQIAANKGQRPSIAEQLKKVVSDPKLKEWLAEQAARAKVRQAAVGQPNHSQQEKVDFGQEPEHSTIKKCPDSKANQKVPRKTPNKPAPNPKPRSLAHKNRRPRSGEGLRPSGPPPQPPGGSTELSAQPQGGSSDEFDDSFDDDSFDTLEDGLENRTESMEDIVESQPGGVPAPNQAEASSDKPKPVPRKRSAHSQRSRSNTEESRGSQELLAWERVGQTGAEPGSANDSYYWEHTGTEEFLQAKQSHTPDLSPVHRLLPEAEYIQMHGLIKGSTSSSSMSPTSPGCKPPSFPGPKSPTSPVQPFTKVSSTPQISPEVKRTTPEPFPDISNPEPAQALHNGFTPVGQVPNNTVQQTQGSIFVHIPGEGQLTDALDKPIGQAVSEEYKFHMDQLDLNASSPDTIRDKIERRISQEEMPHSPHSPGKPIQTQQNEPPSPQNLGIPLLSLDHSPNSKAHQSSRHPSADDQVFTNTLERNKNSPEKSPKEAATAKNIDELYAVVNKSVKRNSSSSSQMSQISSVSNQVMLYVRLSV